MTGLSRLVDPARAAHGGYTGIAHATGISLSALLRALKQPGILGIDKLLALAEAIGERPDVVLKAAGKADAAARLTRLYGTPAKPLSAIDRKLVALSADQKRKILGLLS